MAAEQVDFIGSFASDALATAWVQNRAFDTTGDGAGNPRTGMIYHNTTVPELRLWDGAAWQPAGGGGGGVDQGWKGLMGRTGSTDYLDTTLFNTHVLNEVSSSASPAFGILQWSGGGVQFWPATKDVVGYAQLGSIAANYLRATGNYTKTNMAPPEIVDMIMVLSTDQPGTRTNDWGWANQLAPVNGTSRFGCVFNHVPTVDTNFFAVVASFAGGVFRVDTGVAWAADVFHKFCIKVDNANQVATYYIDDVQVASITAIAAGGWPDSFAAFRYANTGSGTNRWHFRVPWVIAFEY